MTNGNMVERFCTPPAMLETDYDRKAVADAEIEEFSFEGQRLIGYSWGSGRNVLLVHGWGSRASHLAPLGRHLARSGFRVLAFDGPSHGQSLKDGQEQHSNLFEFCRAISTVTKNILPLYAVVGHSLGAVAAAFTVAGHSSLANYKISAEQLVLISSPVNVSRIIKHFCRQEGLGEKEAAELVQGLERAFSFSVAEYSVPLALNKIEANVLLVHDEQDEEIPVTDAVSLKDSREDARLVITRGAGHQRILANRVMIRAVQNFLLLH